MAKITITLNGKKLRVSPDKTILEAARDQGIKIPTLCYHESLAAYGACRFCVVEVISGKVRQVVTSCNTRVRRGLKIETHSPAIQKIRKGLAELLMARSPNVRVVRELALALGVKETPYPNRNEFCILCGLCVRTCREIVGANAVGFAQRGSQKKVATPFFQPSQECIGCGACVYVCPTGVITMQDVTNAAQISPQSREEQGPLRIMQNWKTRLTMQTCRVCGNPFAPSRQLDFLAQRYPVPEGFLDTCYRCRPQS